MNSRSSKQDGLSGQASVRLAVKLAIDGPLGYAQSVIQMLYELIEWLAVVLAIRWLWWWW